MIDRIPELNVALSLLIYVDTIFEFVLIYSNEFINNYATIAMQSVNLAPLAQIAYLIRKSTLPTSFTLSV